MHPQAEPCSNERADMITDPRTITSTRAQAYNHNHNTQTHMHAHPHMHACIFINEAYKAYFYTI